METTVNRTVRKTLTFKDLKPGDLFACGLTEHNDGYVAMVVHPSDRTTSKNVIVVHHTTKDCIGSMFIVHPHDPVYPVTKAHYEYEG